MSLAVIQKVREFISRRRTAYIRTFKAPAAEEVLADLARFCRANRSTFHSDPRAHAVLEGRREVWLRITEHLNLTDEQLWALHAPSPARPIRSDHE